MTEKDGYNGVVLFGMPYLWYGDIAFHNSILFCLKDFPWIDK